MVEAGQIKQVWFQLRLSFSYVELGSSYNLVRVKIKPVVLHVLIHSMIKCQSFSNAYHIFGMIPTFQAATGFTFITIHCET